METFEYDFTPSKSPALMTDVIREFNVRGADGWELVGFNYGVSFWKRKVS